MSSVNSERHIKEFYKYIVEKGFSEDLVFGEDNYERYMETSADGYSRYPLFLHVFGGEYDKKTFERMLSVDFRSRLDVMAGIASPGYESVLLIEPPKAKRTGMLQYVRVADVPSYTLLFKPAIYRLEEYERFALEKRKDLLDENTWYIYIFVTKISRQGQGYGKKLMNLMLSYADLKGCRVCLETNSDDNIAMYEHFGFEAMDTSDHKEMTHCVMLYTGKTAVPHNA